MQVGVTIRTNLEFEDLEDINEAYNIVCGEMAIDEVIELAQNQGQVFNIDVEEF